MEWWGIQWKWEDICGPSGLQPWNETTKDFGLCFQEVFIRVPLFFLIAIISGYYVGYRKDWVLRNKTQERAIVFRSLVVLTLVFAPILELYIYVTNNSYNFYLVKYLSLGSSCLCWLIHFGYLLALKQRLGASCRGPAILLTLWTLAVVANIIYVRSCLLTDSPTGFGIATLCCHVLYFFSLIPSNGSRPTRYSSCLVGSQHTHNEYTPLLGNYDEDVLGTAMEGSSWFSKLTFGWVNPLLSKGLSNQLNDVEEVFDLPSDIRCAYVGAKLDKALIGNVDNFQRYEEVPHEPFIRSGYGATGASVPQSSTPVTPTYRVLVRPERRQNVTLLRALHSCFAFEFYSIGILKLISDMAGFAGPMLLNRLITFIQDPSIDMHMGYIYASALIAAMLLSALFNAHFNWRMSIVSLKIQGAMVYTILNKVLSCTSTELSRNFTVGEITNFMSTDTDRIVNSCPSFHALWSIPLQLFITLYLLYEQVGLSFLAGVAFSVILIPINKLIANKIGRLSTEMMTHKDNRVNLMSDVLRGIRVIKMQVWEDYFVSKVDEARASELSKLRGRKYLDAICVVLWASTPVLVAALTLTVHALRRQTLDAATVFTTVALVNMLIGPLNAFPWVLNGLTEAWVSIKRVQKLLELPEKDPERYYDRLNTNKDEDKIIIMKNATFSWAQSRQKNPEPKSNRKGKRKKMAKGSIQRHDSSTSNEAQDEPFTLSNISLDIGREDFVGITGPVGSGKSSLLHAIMGEMVKKGGSVQLPEGLDSFGYVSQKPWLVRETIRDNIIFGLPYDEAKYKTVVDACGLAEEIQQLSGVVVGEGGSTLSGGQRMRVALARAVYADKRVYLLDDVLSCVDARVGAVIVQRCLRGLLRHRARLLVAHQPAHLHAVNTCLVMREGILHAIGRPEDVLNEVEEYLLTDSDTAEEGRTVNAEECDKEHDDNEDAVSRDSNDEDESMSEGTVDWWVILMYLRSVGSVLCISILLSLILMQTSQNFTFLWLAFWVKSRPTNSTSVSVNDDMTVLDHGFSGIDAMVHGLWNATVSMIHSLDSHNGTSLKSSSEVALQATEVQWYSIDDYYLEMYFVLAAVNVLFTVMRAFLFAYGGVKAAEKIHKLLLKKVVKAKVKFFDATPSGRIINRFSSDTYTVDDTLPFILNILLAQVFALAGAIAVSVYGLPWLGLVFVPLAPVYYWLQLRYRAASRQLKRLHSVARSPIYTQLSDTLQGSTTIVSLGASSRWLCAGAELAARWQRAALSAAAAAAHLTLRLQAAALAVLAAAAALAVLQRTQPATVGLAISYALSMSSMLSGVMNAFTETEREMISVERIGEYIRQVQTETVDGEPAPYGWPSQGVLSFDNVVLKYSGRSQSHPALNGVTFSTYPSEKLGVAGRTGAGKSSIISAILRLADLSSGKILIDGIDISTLHLHALRSRISVIPQEPFIFSGCIRDNVDPLHIHTDAEVQRALERCSCGDTSLTASAAGLSRGRAQLICVARALLHRAKIVLIDEATANLDTETERIILETIECGFVGATVVVVAHRVRGVLACARALTLHAGHVRDLAAPHALLQDPTSDLYKLVHALGE